MMDKEQEKRTNTASAVTMEEPEKMEFEDEQEYVPIDLYANLDYTDEPPPGFFDWWEDDRNPFSETIIRKIGNTWYSISTSCDGTEPLFDKVKRLILNDAGKQKEGS